MKKTIFASLILAAISTTTMASPATSSVTVKGGTLSPHYGEYQMDLNSLYSGINYTITCMADYNNDNGADVYVNMVNSNSELELDGKIVEGNILKLHNQYANGHDIAIHHVTTSAQTQIKFVNLDDKAFVTLRNCVASVE